MGAPGSPSVLEPIQSQSMLRRCSATASEGEDGSPDRSPDRFVEEEHDVDHHQESLQSPTAAFNALGPMVAERRTPVVERPIGPTDSSGGLYLGLGGGGEEDDAEDGAFIQTGATGEAAAQSLPLRSVVEENSYFSPLEEVPACQSGQEFLGLRRAGANDGTTNEPAALTAPRPPTAPPPNLKKSTNSMQISASAPTMGESPTFRSLRRLDRPRLGLNPRHVDLFLSERFRSHTSSFFEGPMLGDDQVARQILLLAGVKQKIVDDLQFGAVSAWQTSLGLSLAGWVMPL